jgi:hypothetical protein
MLKRTALLLLLSASAWTQDISRGELSLSQTQRIVGGGSPSVYDNGRATTLGIGGILILNPTNALRLRYEKSISVPSLPTYNPGQSSVRRDKDFQSLSFAYLHWFDSEASGGWFIGTSASINQVKQDTNYSSPSGPPRDSTSNSGRAAFVSGYQFGKHVGLELHAGLPYSSASLVCRF